MQKVKKILLYLSLTFIVSSILFLVIIVPFVEQFTDLISVSSLRIEADRPLNNLTLLFPVYTYKGEPLIRSEIEKFFRYYNITTVDTEYGRMWKIERDRINKSDMITFSHFPHELPKVPNGIPMAVMDIFDLKVEPVLNKSVIKDEQKGRDYERVVNLTIPVYIYYEGNDTVVKITFYADSGLDSFLTIPVAPKHNGRVYTGEREDKFVVKSKGWSNVTGTSGIWVVYQ